MAVRVSSAIKEILQEKDRKLVNGMDGMRRLLVEVQREIYAELLQVPGDSYTAYYLKQNAASIEARLAGLERQATQMAAGHVADAWDLGLELLPAAAKAGAGLHLGFGHLSTGLLEAVKDFTVGKIAGVYGDTLTKVKGELTLGFMGQKTPAEVARQVAGMVDPLHTKEGLIFETSAQRAETIVQTEMGRGFSMATQATFDASAKYLPGLEKQWLHQGHPKKARLHHVALHGTHIPVSERYLVGNIGMMHPRASGAPAREVVHCGCDSVPYMMGWK